MLWRRWTENKPLGAKIRSFCEQLFTSRHVRFLEAELVRSRTEYQAIIRELKETLARYQQALPIIQGMGAHNTRPKSSTLEVPSAADSNWMAALEEHNRKEQEELIKEK